MLGSLRSRARHGAGPDIAERSPDTEALLRGQQLKAVEINAERALLGFIVTALPTTVLFYPAWGITALVWFCAVMAVCSARLIVARRIAGGPARRISRRGLWPHLCWTIVVAATMTSFPVWVTMTSDGLPFAVMMALALGIFWSSSFVHAPIISSSLTFMGTQLAVCVLAAILAGGGGTRNAMCVLFALGTGTALLIVREHSELFRRSLLQKFDLKDKADTIAFLMEEYQDQSKDRLWQTDSTFNLIEPCERVAGVIGRPVGDLDGSKLTSVLRDRNVAGNLGGISILDKVLSQKDGFRDLLIPVSPNGDLRVLAISGRPVFGSEGAFEGYTGVIADVTSAKLAEERLHHLTLHDPLTDLPNVASMRERLDKLCRAGRTFSVLSLDLDGFDAVNEDYGHAVGDAVLVEVASRLRLVVGHDESLARAGSDRFLVQISFDAVSDIETFCRELIDTICAPIEVRGISLVVGSSVGISIAPVDGDDAEVLINNAAQALRHTKQRDRGGFCFFAQDLDHERQTRRAMLQDLRQALARNEFVLHYQPILSAGSRQVVGCEALLRWQNEARGMVSPVEFIPLLEESGMIGQVGEWVIREACREAAGWDRPARISVNISPIQFRDLDLSATIRSALEASGLLPARLEVEVTETVLVEDAQTALDTLRRIKALGVRIALDDFGTGYSSLSYLRIFPFDKVKIDRSFISNLHESKKNQIIVKAICDIASGLDMTITAEGIEMEREAECLRRTDCDEFQGFLFGRPQPIRALRETFEASSAA